MACPSNTILHGFQDTSYRVEGTKSKVKNSSYGIHTLNRSQYISSLRKSIPRQNQSPDTGAEEMAVRLRYCPALSQDLSLDPSTILVGSQPSVNLAPKGSRASVLQG